MATPIPDSPRGSETEQPRRARPVGADEADTIQADFERMVERKLAAPGGMQAILGQALTTAQRIVRQVGNIDSRMGGACGTDARAIAGDVLMAQELLTEAHRILMNRLVAL